MSNFTCRSGSQLISDSIFFIQKHKRNYIKKKTKSVSQEKTFILSHYLSFPQTVFTSSYIQFLQLHKVYYKPRVHVRVMGITSIFICFISKSIQTAQSRYTQHFVIQFVMYTKRLNILQYKVQEELLHLEHTMSKGVCV